MAYYIELIIIIFLLMPILGMTLYNTAPQDISLAATFGGDTY